MIGLVSQIVAERATYTYHFSNDLNFRVPKMSKGNNTSQASVINHITSVSQEVQRQTQVSNLVKRD